MKLFSKAKDGGLSSPVEAYFLIEWKKYFSIALLKFNEGTRENFHSHAFNAWTWFLSGSMTEETIDGDFIPYKRSLFPKSTPKSLIHKVHTYRTSWCFTVRGPWEKYWKEVTIDNKEITLTHGRNVVSEKELS